MGPSFSALIGSMDTDLFVFEKEGKSKLESKRLVLAVAAVTSTANRNPQVQRIGNISPTKKQSYLASRSPEACYIREAATSH